MSADHNQEEFGGEQVGSRPSNASVTNPAVSQSVCPDWDTIVALLDMIDHFMDTRCNHYLVLGEAMAHQALGTAESKHQAILRLHSLLERLFMKTSDFEHSDAKQLASLIEKKRFAPAADSLREPSEITAELIMSLANGLNHESVNYIALEEHLYGPFLMACLCRLDRSSPGSQEPVAAIRETYMSSLAAWSGPRTVKGLDSREMDNVEWLRFLHYKMSAKREHFEAEKRCHELNEGDARFLNEGLKLAGDDAQFLIQSLEEPFGDIDTLLERRAHITDANALRENAIQIFQRQHLRWRNIIQEELNYRLESQEQLEAYISKFFLAGSLWKTKNEQMETGAKRLYNGGDYNDKDTAV